MFKFLVKLKLLTDRDKLSFVPNPRRDWAILLGVFIILAVLATFFHLNIYLKLGTMNGLSPADNEFPVINERDLSQAIEVINRRRSSDLIPSPVIESGEEEEEEESESEDQE
ncbi:MAG: hypothetical protein WDZ85_04090 [Candidatus Paceibacterota bacterium]